MNRKRSAGQDGSARGSHARAADPTRAAGPMQATGPAQATPPTPAKEGLGRHALRLLAALDAAAAYAFPDPVTEDALILRTERAGVSVGGGRFPREAGESLRATDLAERDARGALRITAAGRAHLRRRRAAPEDGPFRAQHLELVCDRVPDEAGVPMRVRRDAAESPLEWMRRRRDRSGTPLLDAACYEAGERLRRDLTFAALLPRTTANWSVGASGSAPMPRDPAAASDAVIAARQRVNRALEAVGSDLSGLLVDLCGFLKGLESIERERDWPARSGKVVVRLALGRLAEHYGLAREAHGPARALGLRAWREGGPEGA